MPGVRSSATTPQPQRKVMPKKTLKHSVSVTPHDLTLGFHPCTQNCSNYNGGSTQGGCVAAADLHGSDKEQQGPNRLHNSKRGDGGEEGKPRNCETDQRPHINGLAQVTSVPLLNMMMIID